MEAGGVGGWGDAMIGCGCGGIIRCVEEGKDSGKDDIQGLCCTGENDSDIELLGGGAICPSPPNEAELLKPGIIDNASKFMVVYWPRFA